MGGQGMGARVTAAALVLLALVCVGDAAMVASNMGETDGADPPGQYPVLPGGEVLGETDGMRAMSGAARACYHECAGHPKSTPLEFAEATMTMLRRACSRACAAVDMDSEPEDANVIGEGQETIETAKIALNKSPDHTSARG